MKQEHSAGGVVYKTKNDRVFWLVVQHSQHKGWVFPKGLIGDTNANETREETAVREVREEGGVDAEIVAEIKPAVKYWYVFNKEKVQKTVYFFLMKYLKGDIKDHDHEVSATCWLTASEVKAILTYKNDQAVFAEALSLLQKQP